MDKEKNKILNKIYGEYLALLTDIHSTYHIDDYLVNEVMGYGTTKDEIITSLTEFKELIEKQRVQGKDIEMSFDIKPIFRKTLSNDTAAIFVDEIEITMSVNNEKNFLPVRMSTIFEYINDCWKVVHWHGSVGVESENDTWHVDEWKQKAAELEKLVQEKTADLLDKNRELEIETALERVRTVAMGMTKSEDLFSICEVSFTELQKLGFDNLRNAVIHVPNDEQNYFMDYDYSEFTGGDIAKIEYGSHPIVDKYIEKIQSAQDAYFEVVINKDQLSDWKKFRKKSGQSDDSRIDEAEALYYYLFSIGIGDIGISTFKPINDSQIKILKRFRNVFDLAYRRYNDITLAEAQAREAQIEASLERVRSTSMAMHKSEDLANVASVMFEQMKNLGGELFAFGIVLCDKHEGMVEQWHSLGNEGMMPPFFVPINLDYIHQYRYNQWKDGADLFSIEIPEDYIARHFDLMFKLPSVAAAMNEVTAKNINVVVPEWEIDYGASFKNGYLLISSLKPFKEKYIFPRFAKVFEQAYIRFLDLQKAEAQTREAQIEAALEKVRSSSLAMHKSDEIKEVVVTVMEKMNELNIEMNGGVSLATFVPDSNDLIHWYVNPDHVDGPVTMHLPYFDNVLFYDFVEARKSGKEILPVVYSFKQKNEYFKYAFEHSDFKIIHEELKEWILDQPFFGYSVAIQKHSAIFFNDYTGKLFSEEENEVLIRFAKVFDQAYIRFLDLKKAEAQAREAKIEAALERVRSRSMGMQKSEELKEVIQVVYEQFVQLNINIEHTGFIMDYQARDDMYIWLADKHEVPFQVTIPYFDSPHWNSFKEAKASGKDFFANHLSFEEKNKFYQDLFEYIPGVPEETKEYYFNCPGLAISTVLLDNVGLYIENFSGDQYSDEDNKILFRFGKVFQQTYTRFLDLQKAEAQAREAQIEAGLERVRSRSMAMHKSDELLQAGELLYKELSKLGIANLVCGYVLIDKENKVGWNYGVNPGTGTIKPLPTGNPLAGTKVFESITASWEKQEPLLVIELDPQETIKHQTYIAENVINYPITKEQLLSISPEKLKIHTFNFSQGYLLIVGDLLLNVEQQEMVVRFAKVFEQTYTRFLDLKKAEAQAREAKIETALEKVRARTMGMQHSDELPEAANLLFLEVQALGIPAWSAGYNVLAEDKKSSDCWMSSEGAIQEPAILYFTEETSFIEWYDFLQSEETFFVQELGGEALVDHYNYLRSIPRYR